MHFSSQRIINTGKVSTFPSSFQLTHSIHQNKITMSHAFVPKPGKPSPLRRADLQDGWLTEHFNIAEFDCRDGTPVPDAFIPNVYNLALQLEIVRTHFGNKPVHVNSGYRTVTYNARVDGVKSSQHLQAKAADITIKNVPPQELATVLVALIKRKAILPGGVGRYPGFTHYDIRGRLSQWGSIG